MVELCLSQYVCTCMCFAGAPFPHHVNFFSRTCTYNMSISHLLLKLRSFFYFYFYFIFFFLAACGGGGGDGGGGELGGNMYDTTSLRHGRDGFVQRLCSCGVSGGEIEIGHS